MDTNNAWNTEPSPHTVLEEPIIRLLMMRDGVDIAVLRRLLQPTRYSRPILQRPPR